MTWSDFRSSDHESIYLNESNDNSNLIAFILSLNASTKSACEKIIKSNDNEKRLI